MCNRRSIVPGRNGRGASGYGWNSDSANETGADVNREALCRLERLAGVGDVLGDKHASEVVDAEEFFEGVILGFSHITGFDHVKHDSSEILGGLNAPASEDNWTEHSEVLQSEFANAFQKFCTGDVAGFF